MKSLLKKWHIPILLLTIAIDSYANVDIVAKGDTLFVTYIKNSDSAFVYRHGLESPVHTGRFNLGTLCLAELPSSQFVLLWAGSADPASSPYNLNSLVLYDPSTMSVLIDRTISPDELHPWTGETVIDGLRLSRYSLGDTECSVAAALRTDWVDSVDVTNHRWLTIFDVEVAPWGVLGVSDTLRYEVPGWDDFFHRPVHYQEAAPLIIAEHYYWPPEFYGCTSITAGEHTCSGGPGEMLYTNLFYEALNDPYGPDDPKARALALGSTDSCAIGLWSDTTWTVYCSIFGNGLGSVTTYAFDRNFDQLFPACAISCNPQDNGALLVWYENGLIMGRHWENEWNGFDRILADNQPPVDRENISVCSDIDGYWIAWLPDDAAQPSVIYVERDIVTSISSHESSNIDPLFTLRGSPNPFSDAISITATGDFVPDRVEVYELSGRLIKSLDSDQTDGSFIWDGTDSSGNNIPPGLCIVQGRSSGMVSSVTVIKL